MAYASQKVLEHEHVGRVEELGDVVTGRVQIADPRTSTILFESHGLAINDMAMAAKTYELARVQGLGAEIKL